MPVKRQCALLLLAASFSLIPRTLHAREDSGTLYDQGAGQAREGRLDEAIHTFTRSLEINPYYARAHYGIGKAYLMREDGLVKARKHLERAVELDERMASAHFYLGLAYMFSRKYDEAVHSFHRAYDYDPAMVQALYNIAAIYDYLGLEYKVKIYYSKYVTESAE
jgi:tetratricopeptide (TPR) repeat protein